jgi:uncharacterized membrane protein YfcA
VRRNYRLRSALQRMLSWASLAIVLISSVYVALPNRYHMKPDWQEAAVLVMFASVLIAV